MHAQMLYWSCHTNPTLNAKCFQALSHLSSSVQAVIQGGGNQINFQREYKRRESLYR